MSYFFLCQPLSFSDLADVFLNGIVVDMFLDILVGEQKYQQRKCIINK